MSDVHGSQDYEAEALRSLAGPPKGLTERPEPRGGAAAADVLSSVLRAVRLSGSIQFCFMPRGAWQTDAAPSLAHLSRAPGPVTPFHIVVEGTCWLKIEGEALTLGPGDVVAFPFGTGHQLGAGDDGLLVKPLHDLPPKPWRETPVLSYGDGAAQVRLLCGYLDFAAAGFRPLRASLPEVLHVRTQGPPELRWLSATIDRMVAEVDHPRAGGLSVLERLTEITFIELLRHHVATAPSGSGGWLAAMTDPSLARCLALIHGDPGHGWSLKALASACALSRSSLSERFERLLGVSAMRYVRDWRLCLAGVALSTTNAPIAAIAQEAGYGAEAAFNRAFARANGLPPASWRAMARAGA